jgi:hypothetical protein
VNPRALARLPARTTRSLPARARSRR